MKRRKRKRVRKYALLMDLCNDVPPIVLDHIIDLFEGNYPASLIERKLLKYRRKYPDCPEIALYLSYVYADKKGIKHAINFVEQEVKKYINKYNITFQEEIPWSHHGNRPFLSLYYHLGKSTVPRKSNF